MVLTINYLTALAIFNFLDMAVFRLTETRGSGHDRMSASAAARQHPVCESHAHLQGRSGHSTPPLADPFDPSDLA